MPEATSRIISLCLDADDPTRMATFWAEALGWEIGGPDGESSLRPTDDTGFDILFEPTTETKVGRNNIHLDLTTTSIEDRRDTVDRLIEAGARHVDVGQRGDEGHVVLADPEGNEFCVIAPDSTFLAGCPRLGAINADGTRRVGLFWSAVLGWPLIWDQDDETAIRAPDGTGPIIQWSGPPLMTKTGKNRLHLDIAPPAHVRQQDEVDRLVGLGASRIDIGQGDTDWIVMADPDGNEFCVLTPREPSGPPTWRRSVAPSTRTAVRVGDRRSRRQPRELLAAVPGSSAGCGSRRQNRWWVMPLGLGTRS
ncbi:MAG: VOC family protein [Ilumatobacter sp.]|uniref:VOC family protein n=1 Tax=Ilumatobacter sp. TaxID=1967498 RepID=UPI003297746B